uniref:BTB domain-containing protein n=1 Tax=Callorhinchus milii TaxID=7868 RepID=A0A4W3I4G4_CALMI
MLNFKIEEALVNVPITKEKYITRESPSHCTELLERLNSQRSKGLYCDVTLIVEKTSYPAHRAVLAGVSEYFQELFSEKGFTANKEIVGTQTKVPCMSGTRGNFPVL